MALSLEGRTALMIGASKGGGKGIALELARCGCDVVVNYHSDRAGGEALFTHPNWPYPVAG